MEAEMDLGSMYFGSYIIKNLDEIVGGYNPF